MSRKTTISDLNYYAGLNGGKCLSREYKEAHIPIEWRCRKGHRFELSFLYVKRGSWCGQCAKEKYREERLEYYNQLASQRGGKCISKNYVNDHTKLKWQCAKGHVFESLGLNMKRGNWCKKCTALKRQEREYAIINNIVKKKRGECLSPQSTYINGRSKLNVKCSKGHISLLSAYHLKNNSAFCSVCSGKAKHTIEQMDVFAKTKGGSCLSKRYVNNHTKLKWQCKNGHVWKAMPSHIFYGKWCPECRKINLSIRYRTDIKEVRKLAKDRGGKLLSKEYINANLPLQWQCKRGHVWMARYSSLKHLRSWCPVCRRMPGYVRNF